MNAAFEPDPDAWHVLSFADSGFVSSTDTLTRSGGLTELDLFNLELRPGAQTRSHSRPGQ